jgi:hypothetical protein
MSVISSSTPTFSSFREFWRHYPSQHQHPLNRQLHVWGTLGGLTCLSFAWFFSWTLLLAVLPIGYGGAWLGHYLVERNRPLTFSYPVWSLLADFCLVAHVLTGRLSSDGVEAAVVPSRRAT